MKIIVLNSIKVKSIKVNTLFMIQAYLENKGIDIIINSTTLN